jgi:putative salt-induced outer membrane protein YdiY
MLLLYTDGAFADKVILENGDTLTGTVVKVVDGKLTLKTDYSGLIEIQVSKIRKIFTDHPAEVHLTSGEVLKGKIETKEDRQIIVEKSAERETTSVDFQKVASVNPPPPKKWSGSINVGGNIQTGNTDRKGIIVDALAVRKTETDRLRFRYLFNYAEEDGNLTARNQYGEINYNYLFTKKFYGYAAVELLNDKFKDYRLRTIVGPGVGYLVWDDPLKFLSFEAGLAYQNNDFYQGEDKGFLTARLGGEFRYRIFDFLAFSERLLFYPSLGEGGQYILRNEAALTAPLGSGWALRLANIIDYDSNPPPGVDKTDVQYLLSLQFSF